MASGRSAVQMTEEEIEEFLADNMKVQVATIGPDGAPHLTTLFYVLEDGQDRVLDLRRLAEDRQPAPRPADHLPGRGRRGLLRAARREHPAARPPGRGLRRHPALGAQGRQADGRRRRPRRLRRRRSSSSRPPSGSASWSSRRRSPAGTTARCRALPGQATGTVEQGGRRNDDRKIKVDFDLCESNAHVRGAGARALPDRRRRLPADPRRDRHRREPGRRSSRRSPPARSRRISLVEE